jgi:hypothetical protein
MCGIKQTRIPNKSLITCPLVHLKIGISKSDHGAFMPIDNDIVPLGECHGGHTQY